MAHVRMSEQWNNVIEDFERNNPSLADEVIDWYPIGQMEIAVKLRNGKMLTYNLIDNNTSLYYEPEAVDVINEDIWRNEFSLRLRKKMQYTGINQDRLSLKTGISTVTINKYVNGKAIPSGYNLDRIARALKCSVSELMNIR